MSDVTVEPYQPAHRPAVLDLLAQTLSGLRTDDYDAFLRWKHEANPFGTSPAWVAIDPASGEVIGYRAFLRWEFRRQGRTVRAVRAVDTATSPAHQGKGIFTTLTVHGLRELMGEQVAFVFNTPNDKSRPGYLKMGWDTVGRLPVGVLPRSPGTLPRIAGARTAAERWSTPTDAGHDPAEVLADPHRVARWVGDPPDDARLRTPRTPEYLRWRYAGFPLLAYRAFLADDDPDRGVLFARCRRRGGALELAVCDLLQPRRDPAAATRLVRQALRQTGADYALAIGRPAPVFAPLPGMGPILTRRAVCAGAPASLDGWALTLGDVELF